MTDALDLNAYCRRIAWHDAPAARTLAGLTALLQAHMQAIPFENLAVLQGRPPQLGLAALQAKLVTGGRGGYCFEHAGLLGAVLQALGLPHRHHLARVTLMRPREQSPRTHQVIVVQLAEGEFLLDPGLGGLAPAWPVPLAGAAAEAGVGEHRHRLQWRGPQCWLQARLQGEWTDLWASPLDEALPVDFELGNHYTATHPDSAFRQHLMLRAWRPGGRVSVLDREVSWREGDTLRRETLPDRAALRRLLATHFGMDLPEIDALRVPAVPGWD